MTQTPEERQAILETNKQKVIEHFTELMKSDDRVDAVRGRLGIELAPLIETLLVDEIQRINSREDASGLVFGIAELFTQLMTSTCATVADTFGAPSAAIVESALKHSHNTGKELLLIAEEASKTRQ